MWIGWASNCRAEYGEFDLRFVDHGTGSPLTVRLQLVSPKGRPQRIRGLPFWHGQLAVPGSVLCRLTPGTYQFHLDHGPESRDVRGTFQLASGATDSRTISLERIVDMSQHGWYAGDLCVGRALEDLPLAARADEIDVVCRLTDHSIRSRPAREGPEPVPTDGFPLITTDHVLDARGGGRLGIFGCLASNLPDTPSRETPSSGALLMAAAQSSARHMSAIDAAAWDLPMWIASRRLGSLMVLGPPLQADAIRTPSVGWRPHDPELFPGELGPARWSEAIYFRLLNCGLRLPPLAGSGSGWNSNPVGYNRVYVHLAGPLTEDAWWEGLTAGRVMITNGPLMLPLVNGEMPGHVFRASQGQQIVLQPSLNLYTREKIDYLELIQDGRIRENIPLKDWVKEQGRLPSVTFDRSGWLIIRAVTDSPRTLRTVMTGPYYVQIGEQPAVSRSAAEFFREWAQLRKEHLAAGQVSTEVLRFHRAALTYWQQQVDRANVD